MVDIKGGRPDSFDNLKKELKKSAGGGTWVRYIPKDDEITVRFLTEPVDWFKYEEHYTEEASYFPCIGADCPGCAAQARATKRYLANVLDIDNDRVVPLKLPSTLANRLVSRYERKDTLMDRDYILIRQGTGRNTVYDIDQEPRSKFDPDKYEPLDLEQVLVDQFEDAFGDTEDDEDEKDTKKKKSSKAKRLQVSKPKGKSKKSKSKGKKKLAKPSSKKSSRRRRKR